MDTDNPLAGIEELTAGAVLHRCTGSDVLTVGTWAYLLTVLAAQGQGVVPLRLPHDQSAPVILFPAAAGEFGPLLAAAARLVEDGGEAAARETARAAVTLKVLSTVPALRYERSAPPPPDAPPSRQFWYRVQREGGFLATTVGSARDALAGPVPCRAVLPRPAPDDASAWIVLWDQLSAPGYVLSGVWAAVSWPDSGVRHLMQSLQTAAEAMLPGPPEIEGFRPR
ncbi:hypothetical protein AB0G73_28295 [Streptomyces sp. NPDC020719]|uniref:hypothetical protein n=1 Tax=Streptomyces sp. NPDC020719 TaxID=3154896 RepID=UPI0034051E27